MVVGFCILLALILPSAYDEMKEGWKHRVIPNSRTLRDYRNDTYPKDKPGVNYELKDVRKSFSGIQRLMCLCFDKIKIQGSLVFIKYVDELIGFTDLGVSDTRYSTLSDLDKSATHILVYCARGALLWLQVCICFLFNTWYHIFADDSAKLRALRAPEPQVSHALRAFSPHVSRALRALVPHVPRAMRTFVLDLPLALRVLVSHVSYKPFYVSCLVHCLFLRCSCLVPYVFLCSSSLTCSSSFTC